MREETSNWLKQAEIDLATAKDNVKIERVKRFVRALCKKFRIESLFLFGSRAANTHLLDSDYDFLIVSKDFEDVHFLNRISLTLRQTRPAFAVDLLCYTPSEFAHKKKQIGIVQSAVKTGIRLI